MVPGKFEDSSFNFSLKKFQAAFVKDPVLGSIKKRRNSTLSIISLDDRGFE